MSKMVEKWLPIATALSRGAVKIGNGLSVDSEGTVSAAGAGLLSGAVELSAYNVDSPTSASWPVQALAPVDMSGTVAVRAFNDTTSQGIGIGPITVSGNIKLSIRWKAKVDPGAERGVVFVLYKASVFGSWDAGTTLSTALCTDGGANSNEWTITLSAGAYQFEIVRDTSAVADTLVGDAQVAIFGMEAL